MFAIDGEYELGLRIDVVLNDGSYDAADAGIKSRII
jgi:hypothetical protein